MGKLLKKRPISIGFVFTNYNNSLLTIQAIDSIKKSAKNIEYYSVIVDNFSRKKETELLKDVNKIDTNTHIIFNCSNVGYFKGLNLGIAFLKDRYINLDYIVAGNNDLVFKDDFFIQLEKNANLLNEYPVISPDLITLDGVHQNPHVIKGFSRLREIIWDVYFVNYWVSIIISKISSMGKSFFERKD